MNVLHIIANPKPTGESVSKQLAFEFFKTLTSMNADVTVNNVDLYQSKPPYLTQDAMNYFWKPFSEPDYKPTKAEEAAAHYSNNQGSMLKEADVLVLTMPLWLNSMPAIMKAWLDQVIVPGQLFSAGMEGVTPTHHLRRVILLVSSSSVFKEDDPDDGLTPAIRAIFGYIGVTEISSAWADGQDHARFADADARKEMALEAARDLAEEVATMV